MCGEMEASRPPQPAAKSGAQTPGWPHWCYLSRKRGWREVIAETPVFLRTWYGQDGFLSVSQFVAKDQKLGPHRQLIGGQDFVSKMLGLLEK